MSTAIIYFVAGLAAGFVVGVLGAESGRVGSADLTKLKEAAISRTKSAINYLKSNEPNRKSQTEGEVAN